jgi:hypothetical protein
MDDRVILTDCDGVLLNWSYAFSVWAESHGYFPKAEDPGLLYSLSEIYEIEKNQASELVRRFNESAAIGFLPQFRDAIYYVQKLHKEHGYIFKVISSLSTDKAAGELRTRNLKKLFGDTVFDEFIYLDTGADKHDALAKFKNKGYWFVEDKEENARLAYDYGLHGVLIEHGHNMHIKDIPVFKNWKEIYEQIVKRHG